MVSNQCDGVLGLQCRFIEAWECPPCVSWLHLRGREELGLSIVFEGGSIEAGHFIIELTGEGVSELSFGACGNGFVKGNGADLSVFIVGNLWCRSDFL